MSGVAVIGERLQVAGFALAGAIICPADAPAEAEAAWRALAPEVAVVVLTPRAAGWLAGLLPARPSVLPVVMPP